MAAETSTMPKPTVYLETTIVSYLTAWLSRDLVMAGHQRITHEWWNNWRDDFALYISQPVLDEAGAGDPKAAQRRLHFLDGLPRLDVTAEAVNLARALVGGPLPSRADVDALPMAVAAVNGIDYLLTWNCKHIANAEIRPHVERLCRAYGYQPPVMCTPEELLGRESYVAG